MLSDGQVPDGWRVVRLKEILKLEYGFSLPERRRRPGGIPVIGSAGVVGSHNISTVEGPGIVVGRKGSIGKVTWIDEDFVPIDTTYFTKLNNKRVDMRWVFYLLLREDLSKLNRATGIPGLNRDDVYALRRPLPPLPEQRAIAGVLDAIDEAIEQTEAVIAATERLRDSLLHELLTRGVPGWHTKWKEVAGVGMAPACWEVVRLGEVIELEYGFSLPARERRSGRVPVVGSAGVLDSHNIAKVHGPGIVVGRKGSIGTVSWIADDFVPIDTTYFIRIKERVADLRWAYFMLTREDLSKLNSATGVPGLNRDDVYALKRCRPPMPEQRTIAGALVRH